MAFSGNGSLATSEESPQDILNVAGDYGPANSDVRHRFNTDFVIELPFARLGNDGAFTRLLLAGWQTSGLFTANTGGPINVVQTSGFKSSRPDYVGGDAVLSNYRDTLQYINPQRLLRCRWPPRRALRCVRAISAGMRCTGRALGISTWGWRRRFGSQRVSGYSFVRICSTR
jgi:hypothetical protein